MARNLKIRDLTLRDGQQSSFATRMNQEQIDRCLPFYKDANFYAMEVWGGAVPDSVMRYLNENPWTRLETIHKAVGDVSKLTALSRGRNLFGYSPYTDEIIDGFCRNSIRSGLGIMRIFDALNDVDNVKSTVKYVKQYGGIADCAVCYTVDPKYPEPGFWARLTGKSAPKPVFTDACRSGGAGDREICPLSSAPASSAGGRDRPTAPAAPTAAAWAPPERTISPSRSPDSSSRAYPMPRPERKTAPVCRAQSSRAFCFSATATEPAGVS